jgi:hypothetical protein
VTFAPKNLLLPLRKFNTAKMSSTSSMPAAEFVAPIDEVSLRKINNI